jgi:hypothetical protein
MKEAAKNLSEQHKEETLQIGDGLRFGIGFLFLAPLVVSFIVSLFALVFYIFILIFG